MIVAALSYARAFRGVLLLIAVMMAALPGSAFAATVVTGTDPEDAGEPLTIAPDLTTPPTKTLENESAGPVAWIQRMPVDKSVNSIQLGPFSIPETCAATVYAHLRVLEHPYKMLRRPAYGDVPDVEEVGKSAFPVLFNRSRFTIGRWPTEKPIRFKKDHAYSFEINLSGPTAAPPEGETWDWSCYNNVLRRQMWEHHKFVRDMGPLGGIQEFSLVNSADLPCEYTDGPVSLPTVRFFAQPGVDPGWENSGNDDATANDLCLSAVEHAGDPVDTDDGRWMQAHTYVSDTSYHASYYNRAHVAPTEPEVIFEIIKPICGGYTPGEEQTYIDWWQIDPNWFSPPAIMWAGERMVRCYQTTYAPPGEQVEEGWYYGLPVERETYEPFDIYVSLDPAHVSPGATDPRELFGDVNPANPDAARCDALDPVNCATGNFHETTTDLALPGRGIGVSVERTYNAQGAAMGDIGSFGRGWASDIDAAVLPAGNQDDVTVRHGNGATAPFLKGQGTGEFAGGEWVRSKLEKKPDDTFDYELPNHTKLWFDEDGRIVKTADRVGRETIIDRHSSGQVDTISAGGRTFTYSYNGSGYVSGISDGTGRSVSYGYTGDKLTSFTDVAGRTTDYVYDSQGRMTSFTTPRGATVENEYDSLSRVTKQTDPLGEESTLVYTRTTTGTRTKITDREGNITVKRFAHDLPVSITRAWGTPDAATVKMDYDHRSQLRAATDEAGNETRFTYDADGNVKSTTDAEGRRTDFTWSDDLLVRKATPGNRVDEYWYNAGGQPTDIGRGGGYYGDSSYVLYTYDSYGQLTRERNWYSNRVTEYEYDTVGNLTKVTAPGNRVTTYDHDTRGNVTQVTLPAGNASGATPSDHQITYTRDVRGRPLTVTDQEGGVTSYTYDSADNVLSVEDGDGRVTASTYDLLDQQLTRTRGDGGIDKWTYSPEQRVLSQINGLNKSTVFGYDDFGRVVSSTDALNRTSTITYDAVGNAVQVRGPDNEGITSTYDKTGRLLTEVDTSGSPVTTTYDYEADGFLTQVSRGADTVSLEWDKLGRLKQRTRDDGTVTKINWGWNRDLESIEYPDGLERDASSTLQTKDFGTVDYQFNGAGDLTQVNDFDDRQFTFEYDDNGALKKANYPQGDATITRDRVGRVESIATPVGNRAYTYTPGGVRDDVTIGGTTTNFGVDGALHLTQFGSITNAFNAAEQPTTLAEPGGAAVTQTFDAAGQQTARAVASSTLTLDYDDYGRRTVERFGSAHESDYTYDIRGQLTGLATKDRSGTPFTQSMTYGPDGTRRSTERGGVTSYESWEDGLGGPAQLLTQGRDAYIYGPGGMPLERVDSSGDPTYLWQDAIGSIIGTTDGAGATTATFGYDAWGRRTSGFGSQAGTLGFAGQVTERGTDLQYLRARYYDPKTAQFITRDPQEAITGQPYLYAAGNPTMFTDPTGESIFGDTVDNFFGGLARGASWGAAKRGNPCSWATFWGDQLGGVVDPFRKIKAAGKVVNGVADVVRGGNKAEKTTVIGRTRDLDDVGPNEQTLLPRLSDKGSPKANWKQNSGVLREEMRKRRPIRDASAERDPAAPPNFLEMERNLLRNHGWTKRGGYWYPPAD